MDSVYRAWARSGDRGGSVEPDESLGLVHMQLKSILDVFQSDLNDIVADYKAMGAITVDATVGYLFKASMGAKSFSTAEKDLIGVNVGTVMWMSELYVRVCRFSGCLMVNDSAYKKDFDEVWPDEIDIVESITELGAFKDFDFSNIMNITELLISSSRYILHHELAHIWNGHIDWKIAFENGLLDVDQHGASHIQKAFEADADNRAGWAALRQETLCIFHSDNGGRPDGSTFRYFLNALPSINGQTTFEVKAYRFAIAVYLLMRLQIYQQGEGVPSDSHPTSTSRLIWFFDGLYRVWAVNSNQLPERVEKILRYVFYCGEAAFSCVTKEPKIQLSALINQAMDEKRAAFATWNDISDQVKPFLRGLENARYDLARFDFERPAMTGILGRIFSDEQQSHNYLEALTVDIDYYAARLFHASQSSLPALKPAISANNVGALQGRCERLVAISKDITNSINTDPITLWLEFLEHVRLIQEEVKTLMEGHNQDWLNSKSTIEIADGLVLYFTAASRLPVEDAVKCIAREDIFELSDRGLADTFDVVNCEGTLWDAQPYCLQPFDQVSATFTPLTSVVPVAPNKSVRTVAGAMYAVLPFFVSIAAEVGFAHGSFRSEPPTSEN